MRKILNILIVISGAIGLTGLSLLWFKPFMGLNLLSFTVFFAVLCFTSFVFKIYLTRSNIVPFFKWSIAIVLMLPFVISIIGVFEANVLENSWPLLMSTLIFQCLIGYLSILNVFDKNKDLSKLEKVFSTFAAIFSVGVMIVILLKVPISEVYQSFYLGLFVLTILFFASIFLKKTTVE